MKTKHILARVRVTKLKALGFLALTIAVSSGMNAAMIVSDQFSFGYGKDNNTSGLPWTLKTGGGTTSNTIGNFTFTPTVESGIYASNGPIFNNNRVLTNGITNASSTAGNTGTWSMSVTGSYTGTTPADAAANPNFRITLIIENISIYATSYGNPAPPNNLLAWTETTAGHMSSSEPITLIYAGSTAANLNTAANFLPLAWNPDDFLIAGTTSTRSFGFLTDTIRPIDGFEITGRIEITYDAIPEPSTTALGLLGLATISFLFFRKRRPTA